jgi:hypothetical protein
MKLRHSRQVMGSNQDISFVLLEWKWTIYIVARLECDPVRSMDVEVPWYIYLGSNLICCVGQYCRETLSIILIILYLDKTWYIILLYYIHSCVFNYCVWNVSQCFFFMTLFYSSSHHLTFLGFSSFSCFAFLRSKLNLLISLYKQCSLNSKL